MDWILQGNPDRYDFDDYLARYPYVYWSVTRNKNDISLGDSVFIWRAGKFSGVVAIGKVRELPVRRDQVQYPEALGIDLWTTTSDEPSQIKVGVEVNEVRLTLHEGMVPRNIVKQHSVLSNSIIIRQPQHSVFRLSVDEAKSLLLLWSGQSEKISDQTDGEYEGRIRLHQHYMRERSYKIVQLKKDQFKSDNGRLFCELCSFDFAEHYPPTLATDFIEVHHIISISSLETQTRTTLDDLIVVCSNCHRMIHRTNDTQINLNMLREHFG